MNPEYSKETEEFRGEVRQFIDANLPPEWEGLGALDTEAAHAFTASWRALLAQRGYLVPTWPKEYGGAGLTKLQQVILVEEFAKAGVPANGANDNFSIKMIGGLLLKFGTPEQRQHFLPRIVSGEDRWCQGFSEPGSGSPRRVRRRVKSRSSTTHPKTLTASTKVSYYDRILRISATCSRIPASGSEGGNKSSCFFIQSNSLTSY